MTLRKTEGELYASPPLKQRLKLAYTGLYQLKKAIIRPLFYATYHFFDICRVFAPVAQLDRVLPSEGRGRTFESSRVRHFTEGFDFLSFFILQSAQDDFIHTSRHLARIILEQNQSNHKNFPTIPPSPSPNISIYLSIHHMFAHSKQKLTARTQINRFRAVSFVVSKYFLQKNN